jgi:hypothetical protein
MSTHYTVPFPVGVFAVLGVFLVCVAVLATLRVRAGFAAVGVRVRGAHRLGLYDPGPRRAPDTGGARFGGMVRRFTRALRAVSRALPGHPMRNPYTFIVPLMIVGVPVALVSPFVLRAVPVTPFGHVLSVGPAPWSTLLAVLSLFGYFGVVAVLWRVGRRAPVAVGTARTWPGR